jgi:hypothetical protein
VWQRACAIRSDRARAATRAASPAPRLRAEDSRAVCDPALLPCASTEELLPLESVIGQDCVPSAILLRARRFNGAVEKTAKNVGIS